MVRYLTMLEMLDMGPQSLDSDWDSFAGIEVRSTTSEHMKHILCA